MIDPRTEKLIRLLDVPNLKWLPGGRGSERIHVSTVFRWAQHGRRGVRLETIVVSGAKCTTESALIRFFRRVSTAEERMREQCRSQHDADAVKEKLKESGYAA